jgi:flagella basal body P-ring formation protein FlgA
MKKLLLATVTAALLIPTAATAAPSSARAAETGAQAAVENAKVILRESVTVRGRMVRLGDVFVNAGKNTNTRIAYAPEAGKRAVFDARWLYRVARTYGLDWRPMGVQDQIVVERESQMITRGEIEDTILAALVGYGADPGMTMELSNRMLRLYVPADALATVGVEDASYEARTGRFTAIITAPANDPRAARHRVTGRLHKMTEVPVLNRRMTGKEVISKRDITWIQVRSDRLRRDAVVNIDELLGMAAKRSLRPGTPLRSSSIQRPILVAKGSLVTIYLKAPRMTLTTRGKALENGSAGDTVRIANIRSKTIIEAEVTGMGKVSARPVGFAMIN